MKIMKCSKASSLSLSWREFGCRQLLLVELEGQEDLTLRFCIWDRCSFEWTIAKDKAYGIYGDML